MEKRDMSERLSRAVGTFKTSDLEKHERGRWEVASNALATIHAFRNTRPLRKREIDVKDLKQCQDDARRVLLGVFKFQCGILKSDEDNTNVSIYTRERFEGWLNSVSKILNSIPVDIPNRVVPAAAESEHASFEIQDTWRTLWNHSFLYLADEYAGPCESEEDRVDACGACGGEGEARAGDRVRRPLCVGRRPLALAGVHAALPVPGAASILLRAPMGLAAR